MKFVLEVDMDGPQLAQDPIKELGRILRYWAGNLHYYQMEPGDAVVISDSAYAEVGAWRIVSD